MCADHAENYTWMQSISLTRSHIMMLNRSSQLGLNVKIACAREKKMRQKTMERAGAARIGGSCCTSKGNMQAGPVVLDYDESGLYPLWLQREWRLKLDFQPFLCTHRVDTAALASFIEHFETLWSRLHKITWKFWGGYQVRKYCVTHAECLWICIAGVMVL